jgi:hypothetical protein
VWVKGLRQPIGSDVKQEAVGHIVHSPTEPLLVDLEGVVREVHPMRNDEVHHRVQVAVKHPSVDGEDSKTFLKQPMRRRWGERRKIGVAHGGLRQGPSLRTPLKSLNKAGGHAFKRFV